MKNKTESNSKNKSENTMKNRDVDEKTKVKVTDSQEIIVAGDDAPYSQDAEMKTIVFESQETLVRGGDAPFDPDALDIDLERLGRQRPESLPTALRELAFCFSIIWSMVMAEYFVSGVHIILPPLSNSLSIPTANQTWVSSVLTLSAGASLLPLGRMADMFGGHVVFNAGMIWFSGWSLAAGFTNSYISFILCRAMQGLGASAVLPTGIMLLGRVYRPGPRKNFVFSMYGAIAPMGFFFGMIMGGVAAEKLSWRWFFWLGGAITFAASGVSLFAIPRDWKSTRAMGVRMDWWGLVTICPGLVLIVFCITQSSAAPQGWASPYIIVSVVLGVALLVAGVYVQRNVSADPFLPAEIFEPKYMKAMLVCLFLAYGGFGIFLYYTNFYIELVLHVSPLNTALWYTPWVVSGVFFATFSGFVLHLIASRILLVFCSVAALGAALFFALMPESPNYWANVLPAMALETAFVDILYTTSNVFITTRLPRRHQGLAGALINCTLYVGMCFFLGIADVAVAANAHKGRADSYKVAFWIVVAVSIVIMVAFLFMDIGSAKSELTEDEKRVRRELETEGPPTGTTSTEALAKTAAEPEVSTAASSTETLTSGNLTPAVPKAATEVEISAAAAEGVHPLEPRAS